MKKATTKKSKSISPDKNLVVAVSGEILLSQKQKHYLFILKNPKQINNIEQTGHYFLSRTYATIENCVEVFKYKYPRCEIIEPCLWSETEF